MDAELRAARDLAPLDAHVVRLLERDAVAVVVTHDTVLYRRAVAAVEEDAAAAAAIERGVVRAVAFNGEVLKPSAAHVVAGDDGEDGSGGGFARDEVVGADGGAP